MKKYRHPVNGRIERVGWQNVLWALLLGVIYFMYKGLWKHVAVMLAIMILLGFATFSNLDFNDLDVKTMQDAQMETDVIVYLAWIVYAFLVPGILRNRYLDSGWEEVK